MPKISYPRSSPKLDMTPMVDLAFLLVTFFMLTTKFRPDEPVIVDTPSSVSEIKLPDIDIMTITIDPAGKLFFNIDGKQTRLNVLQKMAERYNVPFDANESKRFSVLSSFGLPIRELKAYLPLGEEGRKQIKQTGIPFDSTNNELTDWVRFSRLENPQFRIAVKGDRQSNYKTVKRVIEILQENKVNKFNLITNLEQTTN
jgi:biopolymer transport protein ExbD